MESKKPFLPFCKIAACIQEQDVGPDTMFGERAGCNSVSQAILESKCKSLQYYLWYRHSSLYFKAATFTRCRLRPSRPGPVLLARLSGLDDFKFEPTRLRNLCVEQS